jgi:hypothetical protein
MKRGQPGQRRSAQPRAMLLGVAASLGVLVASPTLARAELGEAGSDLELVKGAQGLEPLADADLADLRGGYLSADANASSSARRRVILWDEARIIPPPLMTPDSRNSLDFQQGPDAHSSILLSH